MKITSLHTQVLEASAAPDFYIDPSEVDTFAS